MKNLLFVDMKARVLAHNKGRRSKFWSGSLFTSILCMREAKALVSLRICTTNLPEPLLFGDDISTKILCVGSIFSLNLRYSRVIAWGWRAK